MSRSSKEENGARLQHVGVAFRNNKIVGMYVDTMQMRPGVTVADLRRKAESDFARMTGKFNALAKSEHPEPGVKYADEAQLQERSKTCRTAGLENSATELDITLTRVKDEERKMALRATEKNMTPDPNPGASAARGQTLKQEVRRGM